MPISHSPHSISSRSVSLFPIILPTSPLSLISLSNQPVSLSLSLSLSLALSLSIYLSLFTIYLTNSFPPCLCYCFYIFSRSVCLSVNLPLSLLAIFLCSFLPVHTCLHCFQSHLSDSLWRWHIHCI